MVKKITGSNKSSRNGLKNEMLPKQVRLKACVQKAYGQWERVGVPSEVPNAHSSLGATLGTSQHQTGTRRNREHGRGGVCVCACVCMRVHV